jgi:nitrite reductase/ring-hydroxylating ferredoxin subunit
MNQDVRTSLNGVNASTMIARLDDMPDGELLEYQARIDGEDQSLIVLRDGDAVRAWMNICPHAGRSLGWAPGKFLKSKDGLLICAVHGASFELQRGECVAGPCKGQSLRAVAVAIVDGEVRV